MTRYRRNRALLYRSNAMLDDMKEDAAKFAGDVNKKVDAKADSLLDKLKASKWTGLILGCGLGAVLVIFALLAAK